MKNLRLLTALLTMLSFHSVYANEKRSAIDIVEQAESKCYFYRLKSGMDETLVINMNYGEAEVVSSKDRMRLKSAEVMQVDLVFTDFPKGEDLTDLNLKRIRSIQSLRPDLVTDPSINWKIVRQMNCKNESEAKILFHGIVIHFRSAQSKESTIRDISFANEFLPAEASRGLLLSKSHSLPDSTVFAVLNRKKKEWTDMTIAADLTGSMMPYTAQLVLWFKLNLNQNKSTLKNVVFFNDGDNKQDYEKVIGSTGGIYKDRVKNYEQLRKLALKTTMSGYGGDGPENDIEALIEAQKFDSTAREIILVADNWSKIKDYRLVPSLKKPVRVILCGTTYGINVEYLNLARATGGSVHTIEEDLENLIKLNEGETFKFNGKNYKIEGRRIIELKKT